MRNVLKFNKRKCKVLKRATERDKLRHWGPTCWRALCREGPWGPAGQQADHEPAMRLHSEEGHSGMYYEEHRPQVKGTDPSALVRRHFGALRDQV